MRVCDESMRNILESDDRQGERIVASMERAGRWCKIPLEGRVEPYLGSLRLDLPSTREGTAAKELVRKIRADHL